jgi:hypothetical protein
VNSQKARPHKPSHPVEGDAAAADVAITIPAAAEEEEEEDTRTK